MRKPLAEVPGVAVGREELALCGAPGDAGDLRSESASAARRETLLRSRNDTFHSSYAARPVLTGPVLTRNYFNFAKFG